jgi:hypothetical protein
MYFGNKGIFMRQGQISKVRFRLAFEGDKDKFATDNASAIFEGASVEGPSVAPV